jgi:uncharacterized protein (TIGR03067 family)
MTIRKLFSVALVVLIAGLVGADAGDANARQEKKDDRAQLQGTWVVQSAEEEGKPNTELDKAKFMFKDDKLTIKLKDEKDPTDLTFKLGADKALKTIDLAPPADKAVGEGIYELSGDMLKLCVAEVGIAKRPSELKAKDKGITLLVLKREPK